MDTLNLDCLVFGYRKVVAENGGRERLVLAFLRLGIFAEECNDGFIIKERDFNAFRRYAGGRVRYKASETRGLFGSLKRARHRLPTVAAILLAFSLNLLLSFTVWDVRISGNESVSDGEIVTALRAAGFGVGSVWGLADTDRAELEVAKSLDEISWIKINRTGMVAYVEVIEGKSSPDKTEPIYSASNIVATHSALIEEITVKSGVALVKAGDVVRAGDILISGIVDNEGGTELVRAEGEVIGRISDTVTASVSRVEELREAIKCDVVGMGIEIFGFRLNIFKKYRNLPDDCAIIEEKTNFVLPGDKNLPVAIVKSYSQYTDVSALTYADFELPGIAADRLTEALNGALIGRDLISIISSGEYTDDGYSISANIVYAENIGKEAEIKTEG